MFYLSQLFLIVFCTNLRILLIFHSFSSIASHMFFVNKIYKKIIYIIFEELEDVEDEEIKSFA